MPNHVYRMLKEKQIEVSEEEAAQLQQMWEFVQAFKKDYDQTAQNTEEIALRFLPKMIKRGSQHEP